MLQANERQQKEKTLQEWEKRDSINRHSVIHYTKILTTASTMFAQYGTKAFTITDFRYRLSSSKLNISPSIRIKGLFPTSSKPTWTASSRLVIMATSDCSTEDGIRQHRSPFQYRQVPLLKVIFITLSVECAIIAENRYRNPNLIQQTSHEWTTKQSFTSITMPSEEFVIPTKR